MTKAGCKITAAWIQAYVASSTTTFAENVRTGVSKLKKTKLQSFLGTEKQTGHLETLNLQLLFLVQKKILPPQQKPTAPTLVMPLPFRASMTDFACSKP